MNSLSDASALLDKLLKLDRILFQRMILLVRAFAFQIAAFFKRTTERFKRNEVSMCNEHTSF